MYCQNCGCELGPEAKFCPECGTSTAPGGQPGRQVNQAAMASAMMHKKSELGAVLMSLFITGLGHMYVGKTVKGFILLLAQVLVAVVLFFVVLSYGVYYTSDGIMSVGVLGCMGLAVLLWIYGMYDAHREAKAFNAYLLQNAGMTPY